MDRIYFSQPTLVKYFLNKNALAILNVINNDSNYFAKDLLKKLREINVDISKCQFHRYIDSLDKYNLIKVSSWVISPEGNGYRYEITQKGIKVIRFLSKMFED